jgi:uncharacterized membrane protein
VSHFEWKAKFQSHFLGGMVMEQLKIEPLKIELWMKKSNIYAFLLLILVLFILFVDYLMGSSPLWILVISLLSLVTAMISLTIYQVYAFYVRKYNKMLKRVKSGE